MNKTELIKSISKSTEVDEDTTRKVINGMVDTIKEALWIGNNVAIKDFIHFKLEVKREMTISNFGNPIVIPKHFVVKITIPGNFKNKIKSKIVH